MKRDRKLGYLPFEGHQSRLGHYYRHLYQMVKFVEREAPAVSDVMEHMRTIRAQLSTHEQALLLLNSLTPMGGGWWVNKLIDGFFMVHNIPKDFFDPRFELDPSSLFAPDYFETVEPNLKTPASLDIPLLKPAAKRLEYGSMRFNAPHVRSKSLSTLGCLLPTPPLQRRVYAMRGW